MEITDIRVLKVPGPGRLRGYASVELDGVFVVHDIRIIAGDEALFVSMPSRKVADNCPGCQGRTPLVENYCGHCGKRLAPFYERSNLDARGKRKLYSDVAHPICPLFRETLSSRILAVYAETPDAPPTDTPVLSGAVSSGMIT